MSCYVYILRCDKLVYYTGLTNNMERRIKEHRTKKSGYTAKFKTKEIVFLYKVENRKVARRLEIYIKSIGAKRFLIKNEKSIKDDEMTILYNKEKMII